MFQELRQQFLYYFYSFSSYFLNPGAMLNFKFRTSLISTQMCQMFLCSSRQCTSIWDFYILFLSRNSQRKDFLQGLVRLIAENSLSSRHGVIQHSRSSASVSMLFSNDQLFLVNLNCEFIHVTSFLLHLGLAFSSFNRETSLESHRTWLRTFCRVLHI